MGLVKSFSIYTIAQVANKGIGFLLLPFFTAYLTTRDYGIISLYSSAMAVATIVIMCGVDGGVRRQFFRLEGNAFSDYFSSAAYIPIVVFILISVICLLVKDQLSSFLGVSSIWVYLLPVVSLAAVYDQVQLGIYRVKEQAVAFGIFNISQLGVNILLGIFFIAFLNYGYEGRLYGILFANVAFSIFSFYLFFQQGYLSGKPSREHVTYAIRYGLPLIPHHIGALIINSADRFFIAEMVSTEAVGIYSVGYTIGSIIMIIQDAFVNAFIPFVFKELKENNNQPTRKINVASWYFALGLLVSVLLLSAGAPIVFKFFIDQKFHDGVYFVFWVAFGYFFLGCYKIFSVYIFYFEKTIWLTYLSILNVVVNLLLNYFLIRAYGAIGAAYATAVSFFILFVVTYFASRYLRSSIR